MLFKRCGREQALILFRIFRVVESRESRDIDQKLLDVESGRREGLAQLVHNVWTIRKNGLFDNDVEELLDEGAMGVIVVSGEFSNVARAGEFYDFAFVGQIFGESVDLFAVVCFAEFSNGVKMFEAEAERIDERMAALAILVFG